MPARPTIYTRHVLHDRTRDGATDDPRDRDRGHEQGNHACPIFRGKPIGQIKNNAGEKSGLARTKQKAHGVKSGGGVHTKKNRYGLHIHKGRRKKSPDNQDTGDPKSGADFIEDEITGYLEKKVADEEPARRRRIDGLAKAQVLTHLQLGETDVDAIKEGDHVE